MIVIELKELEGNGWIFSLTGSLNLIDSNVRLKTSLNRLNITSGVEEYMLPIDSGGAIKLLQEIEGLLKKFSIDYELGRNVLEEFKSYKDELAQFDIFKQKAYQIRNDKFTEEPNLISEFKEFKEVITKTFKRLPRPHQWLSAFHLAFSQNACNFAVPGAGKTSIVYAAYAYLKSLPVDDPRRVDRLVVIGPLSSFRPWVIEYEKCFGIEPSHQRLSGDLPKEGDDTRKGPNKISREEKLEHLYSTNPAELTLIYHGGVESLKEDLVNFLRKNKCMVVVDEAHRIKNPDGIWGQSITEISKEARARVILTGTPLPNGYQDIFNLYKFIYPFKYKDIIGFHYQNLQEMTKSKEIDSSRVEQLKENLSPFFIRIKKQDLKLPPVEEYLIDLEMSPYQREIYDVIADKYINEFKFQRHSDVADYVNKARLIRMRQAASNPSLLKNSIIDSLENNQGSGEFDPNTKYAKYDDFEKSDQNFFNEILDYENNETPIKFVKTLEIVRKVISENQKILIWTIFVNNAKRLQSYLIKNGVSVNLLIGEVSQADREETIEKFNNPANTDFSVVIANPFAVAESISLHMGCHNALYLERDYNCANFIQSKDRIHRVGLTDQVTRYFYLVSKDSIDEIIHSSLLKKMERMDKIINDEIPLLARINDEDESDIIAQLIKQNA